MKLRLANLGKKHSLETRRKMSGKVPWNKDKPFLAEESNPAWKGENAGYVAIHLWVKRKLGMPNKCENCGTTEASLFEWSNISLEYKRDLTDWERLCVSCHRKKDAHNDHSKLLERFPEYH